MPSVSISRQRSGTGIWSVGKAWGVREGGGLGQGVRNGVEDEEPVVAFQAGEFGRPAFGKPGLAPPRLLLLGRYAERAISFQGVLVVGIPPAFLDDAQRLDQPPAIRHGNLVGREGFRRR